MGDRINELSSSFFISVNVQKDLGSKRGLDVADMCKPALLIGKDICFFPYKGKY